MAWKRGSSPAHWYPRRGDVCLARLDTDRPVIILSSDSLNRFSLDVCVIPVSTAEHRQFSLRPQIAAREAGLDRDSWAKCDQIITLEKRRVCYPPLGSLRPETLDKVEEAVRQSLEL